MYVLRNWARISALLPFFMLAACGGGGGGGGGNGTFPGFSTTAADSMLLPFVTAAGELQLLDPAAPASTPITVDTGLDLPDHFGNGFGATPFASVQHVYGAVYEASTNSALGHHRRFAWYLKNGTPYRVDLLNTSSHEPVQFSSITDACEWNGMAIAYDDPLNTRLALRVAGDDASCYTGDDVGRFVALGASSSDGGLTAGPDLFFLEFVTATDGSLQRVLAFDFVTGDLVSYAPDLSSPKLLMTTNPDSFSGGPDPARTSQYFRLEPVGGAAGLYRYDATADAVTLVHAYANGAPRFSIADGEYLYFSDGSVLYRVGHASTTPQPLHTFESSVVVERVDATANRLVFVLRDSASSLRSLESLPKAGSGTRTVLEPAAAVALEIPATANTLVYYNRTVGTATTALRVGEAGAGKATLTDARWVGALAYTDIDLGATDTHLSARTLLLGASDAAGVVTVRGVDARSGAEGPVLGTVPGAIGGRLPVGSLGRYALLNVLQGDGVGGEDFDVYFIDVPTAGSLRQVFATPGLDDVAP